MNAPSIEELQAAHRAGERPTDAVCRCLLRLESIGELVISTPTTNRAFDYEAWDAASNDLRVAFANLRKQVGAVP